MAVTVLGMDGDTWGALSVGIGGALVFITAAQAIGETSGVRHGCSRCQAQGEEAQEQQECAHETVRQQATNRNCDGQD